MLLKPDGSLLQMQAMLPYFQKLPFADILFMNYTFPGIALICVNGITNLTAAILLFMKKKSGIICGMTFGITLMLWICIQFYMFPMNPLSTVYFIFGLLQAVTGYAAWVFYRQEQFLVDTDEYKNIGTNKKELVIYFSRMGYTKKVAYEEADRLGAEVYEITTPEPTSGTGGFWWCGYFAMQRKNMPINEKKANLTAYEHITVCTPIWVFGICSPIQAFLEQAKGRIKSVSYVFVHNTNIKYEKTAVEADKLLGITSKNNKDICCKVGAMRPVNK